MTCSMTHRILLIWVLNSFSQASRSRSAGFLKGVIMSFPTYPLCITVKGRAYHGGDAGAAVDGGCCVELALAVGRLLRPASSPRCHLGATGIVNQGEGFSVFRRTFGSAGGGEGGCPAPEAAVFGEVSGVVEVDVV